ncbi:hypothetical protein [Virgisporangium aurantiacum]|uniref:Uncharacterized protein n=1 Tax=Virgisporangium aurantiacum TaxID=175570 RepID=A0A8J4E718_9ACTN|nr:hypothetical protein [Virgisporangium aurantiacum]GIJ63819.1 hypothetical protein Vau01_113350 [Virgisporangium aurantiacum]
MTDLTDALRRSLTDNAHHAPDVVGLDARVYARSRRIGWRRRGLVATGMALALAITTPMAVRLMPDDRIDRPADVPALEPNTAPPPEVPVRVTYLPSQVSDVQPLVWTWPGGSGLRYHTAGHGAGTVPMIWVNVQAADPRTEEGTETVSDTTVHGKPATVIETSMGDWRGIAWQRTPDAWTVVWGDVSATAVARADAQMLTAVAAGIADGGTTGQVPVTLAVVPRGYVVGEIRDVTTRLCPDPCAPEPGSRDITVELERADGSPTPPGTRMPVGQRTGWLDRTETGSVLRVPLDDGTVLRVQAPLPDADLVELAAGVTVTPGFRPTGG